MKKEEEKKLRRLALNALEEPAQTEECQQPPLQRPLLEDGSVTTRCHGKTIHCPVSYTHLTLPTIA